MTSIEGPPATSEEIPARPPVVVKKYANRRLYNTETSSYITLDNLADMVRIGRDFVVYDARSGDDITRSVLTQIIVEEESKGRALLPTTFLRQLIGFYGDSIGGMVPRYLEHTMSAIARQQEQMREAMQQTMGSLLPPGLDEMRRQNIAMMERAMSLFSPFYRPGAQEMGAQELGAQEPGLQEPGSAATDQGRLAPVPGGDASGQRVEALQREVESLRAQLALQAASSPKPVALQAASSPKPVALQAASSPKPVALQTASGPKPGEQKPAEHEPAASVPAGLERPKRKVAD